MVFQVFAAWYGSCVIKPLDVLQHDIGIAVLHVTVFLTEYPWFLFGLIYYLFNI